MPRDPKLVPRASPITPAPGQPVLSPKPVATLEKLNTDAAKTVYRERISSDEIRLIKIHSGGEPSAVQCSTFNVQRGDLPDYEALSYVWGTQNSPKTILLNGVTWHVTPSLYYALLHLRFTDRFRVIWIDALAINQTDIQERNEQVKEMSAIYANAKSTIIWLGEAKDDLIVDTFKLLKGYSELTETGRREWRTTLTMEDTSLKARTVSMLNKVFKLEYWERIWVVQEILFSDKAVLTYGQNTLAYDEFLACMQEICAVLAKSPPDLEDLLLGDLAASSLASLAHLTTVMISEVMPACGAARHGNYLTLREWRIAQLKRSMDRRDKVFGFYGCFQAPVQKEIHVDYSKTLPEVITPMMRLLLLEEGLNMLFGPRTGYDPTFGIPSWVWSLMDPATVHSRAIGTINTLVDNNPGDWCAGGSLPSVMNFSEDSTVLHVRGKTIATIEATAPSFSSVPRSALNVLSFSDNSSADLNFETLMEHFRLAWQSLSLLPEFPSTLGFITAFWLGPSGSVLSELATWLGAGGSGSLEAIHTEYIHRVDNLMSIHFNRRMYYFMPLTMPQSTDPMVRHMRGQIHGESGLGPEDVAPGDKIYVLRGCSVPVVLRQEQDQYILLGEAYVPLAMHGEVVLTTEDEEYEDIWIR